MARLNPRWRGWRQVADSTVSLIEFYPFVSPESLIS